MARTMSQGVRVRVEGTVGGWTLSMRPGVEVEWRVRETSGSGMEVVEGVRVGAVDMASWGRMGIWT